MVGGCRWLVEGGEIWKVMEGLSMFFDVFVSELVNYTCL